MNAPLRDSTNELHDLSLHLFSSEAEVCFNTQSCSLNTSEKTYKCSGQSGESENENSTLALKAAHQALGFIIKHSSSSQHGRRQWVIRLEPVPDVVMIVKLQD